jgi:membrane protein implicated in regulation of membrane protease activity
MPPPTKTPTAFIAAGAVLLAMPLLIAFGMLVLGIAAGMPDSDPQVSSVLLTGFVVWIVLVLVIVTVFVVRLLRRRHQQVSPDE